MVQNVQVLQWRSHGIKRQILCDVMWHHMEESIQDLILKCSQDKQLSSLELLLLFLSLLWTPLILYNYFFRVALGVSENWTLRTWVKWKIFSTNRINPLMQNMGRKWPGWVFLFYLCNELLSPFSIQGIPQLVCFWSSYILISFFPVLLFE